MSIWGDLRLFSDTVLIRVIIMRQESIFSEAELARENYVYIEKKKLDLLYGFYLRKLEFRGKM